MLSKSVLAASLALVSLQAVLATPQTTISLVIGAAPTDGSSDDDSLPAGLVAEGEVLGTGPDGTTYAISLAQTYSDGTATSTTLVETITAVQDASHVSYVEVDTQDSGIVSDMVVCSYGSGNAVCTEVSNESDTVTTEGFTYTTTGSIEAIPVVVQTGSADSKGSGSGSATASGASSTSTSSDAMSIVVSGFVSLGASIFGLSLIL